MKLSRIAAMTLATTLLVPAGTALGQDASPVPSPTTLSESAQLLYDAFPEEIGGVPLAESLQIVSGSEVVAEDPDEEGVALLADTADSLGIDLADISVGSAATFNDLDAETGVFMIALRVPGMDPDALRQLLMDVFLVDAEEGLIFGEDVVAGREVITMSSPDDPEAMAHFYAGGDIAWMIGAPVRAELEDAISQLP